MIEEPVEEVEEDSEPIMPGKKTTKTTTKIRM